MTTLPRIRRSTPAARARWLACALPLLLACSASPSPASHPLPPGPEAPAVAGPARWALVDHLGVRFDEAGQGSPDPRPEPAVADGVRVVVEAGTVLASARHADRLSGFRSVPAWLGGGFVLWSEDRVYLAREFLGALAPIADVGATGGARPWLGTVLLRTPSGLFALDPRVPGSLRRAAMPGVADALAIDARRGVRLDMLGRASVTTDGGASWTDVTATRGVRVRALEEGAAGEIVLVGDTGQNLVLGAEGALHAPPEPPLTTSPLGETRTADPMLSRSASRALPGETLAQEAVAGVLVPGARIVLARDDGVSVFAQRTGLAIGDSDVPSVDERFNRCQAVPLDVPPAGFACSAEAGALVLDLDGRLALPLLEATFPAGGGFFAGPRGRLAYDGGCGPDPPASTDLGPGSVHTPDPDDEGPSNPVPAPEPAEPPAPVPDAARACVRAGRARWVEHRLEGDDARRLYRWVPGADGAVTALVLAGKDRGDAGPDDAAHEDAEHDDDEDAGGDAGVAGDAGGGRTDAGRLDAGSEDAGSGDAGAGPEARVTTTADGLRVIRVDPDDPALGGGAFPAVPPPQYVPGHGSVDTTFWEDDDGSVRGWIHVPADGGEKLETTPIGQGPAERLLPVVTYRGGRMAGVRIDATGRVTVLPPPPRTFRVVTGGPFALAMAEGAPAGDGGPAPAGRSWFETTDGGATWTPIEAPPVGTLEAPSDDSASFGCSPVGCAFPPGVVRIGWGSKPPEPPAELTLTAAANPRIRDPEPLAITCHLDADALPPAHAGRHAPAPAAPIALRLPATTVGALRDHAWTGEVLPPFQPAATLRRLAVTDAALGTNQGAVVPVLAAGAGRGAPVDLLLLVDKRRLRAGGGPASFLPWIADAHPTVAADAPGGDLVLLDAERGNLWIARGEAATLALHLLRIPDVSRTRLTLARRLAGGALALAGYSTTTGEMFAGALDLGRAEVGPLASLGRLDRVAEAGACGAATHRLLIELPVRLRGLGKKGEAIFEEAVTASVVVVAGGEGVCAEAVEATLRNGEVVLRATLGAGGTASVWSGGGAARGACEVTKRE